MCCALIFSLLSPSPRLFLPRDDYFSPLTSFFVSDAASAMPAFPIFLDAITLPLLLRLLIAMSHAIRYEL